MKIARVEAVTVHIPNKGEYRYTDPLAAASNTAKPRVPGTVA